MRDACPARVDPLSSPAPSGPGGACSAPGPRTKEGASSAALAAVKLGGDPVEDGKWIHWIYLIVFLPLFTEWMEHGALPRTARGSLTEVLLTLAFAGVAWLIHRQYARLKALVEIDAVTGIGNIRSFQRDLRREVGRARRQGSSLSLAFLDLDSFKGINDTHGHAEGDKVLVRFAKLLGDSVRRHVDSCYRVGGDEFTLILPGNTGSGAAGMVERIRIEAKGEPTALERYGAGVSGGVVEWELSEDAAALVRRADRLMYAAKAGGKNRILV